MQAKILAVCLGALVVLLDTADASPAVLCASSSGVVRVRESCRRSENALDVDALGLRGPQGAPGLDGGSGVSCWDADSDDQCDPEEDRDGGGSCTPADCNSRLNQCQFRYWPVGQTGEQVCSAFAEVCVFIAAQQTSGSDGPSLPLGCANVAQPSNPDSYIHIRGEAVCCR